jgi:hypothetical protein
MVSDTAEDVRRRLARTSDYAQVGEKPAGPARPRRGASTCLRVTGSAALDHVARVECAGVDSAIAVGAVVTADSVDRPKRVVAAEPVNLGGAGPAVGADGAEVSSPYTGGQR